MSEDEFLSRWSRRKQEAKANVVLPNAEMREEAQSAPLPAVKDDELDVDLSSLPPIDEITSATDITAFLRKGIPQELTRAALRRAWSADPTIREFIGLAENAWDFNDPNAMPGFGPLNYSEGKLAELADRIVGGLRKAAETLPDSAEAADSLQELQHESQQESQPELSQDERVEMVVDQSSAVQLAAASTATEPMAVESVEIDSESLRHRTHGGALPR
jgi:hypothetical protein